MKLYEDRAAEKINERNYEMLSNKYQAEQDQLLIKQSEIKAQINANKSTEVSQADNRKRRPYAYF